MSIVIRTSELRRPDRAAIQIVKKIPDGLAPPFGHGGPTAGATRPGEVLFPRWIPGIGMRMVRTPVGALPAGWQSVGVRVPMRLASCEEVRCPFFLRGWTEVLPGDGNRHGKVGKLTEEQAVANFGRYQRQTPTRIFHEPGTPCPGDVSRQVPGEPYSPRVHKLPSGIPPLYTVDGRPTLWNEFEDSLGGGLHRAARLRQEGVA